MATFVISGRRVLLLFHRKLQRWLPPGGHIEEGELPDEAAIREVLEETGILCQLLPPPPVPPPVEGPQRLALPEGIQLEWIADDHEHIDLVYLAVPVGDLVPRECSNESQAVGWYDIEVLGELGVTGEVRVWAEHAVRMVAERLALSQAVPVHGPTVG
ncbi:MAG: NUDIX domain-containing protein [Chloroflexi bacterium]|nr:NUDIX domain-containing protein [Chloroflexota bacterium]